MRRFVVIAAAAMMVATLAVGTVAAGTGSFWKAPPFSSIGIKNVGPIGNDYALGGAGSTILRLWMETGSGSEACLATMGEANHAPTVGTVYCSSRFVTLEDNKQHWGVAVTLFLDGPLEDDASYTDPFLVPAWYSLNVYQEGARFFGSPRICTMDGC